MKAFIIGNGISLTSEDLDLIKGLPSFACNRINLIYDRTKWRPTYYVHPEVVRPNLEYIRENVENNIKCFIGEYYKEGIHPDGGIKDRENIVWLNDCHHHKMNYANMDLPDEWHLPQPCSFGGSVNLCMQIAVLSGYDDLILLGCDLQYKDHKPSHFDKRYETGGEQTAFIAARNAFWGHICAMNYIRRKRLDVNVRNATRGGLLEIWPRVNLEDIL